MTEYQKKIKRYEEEELKENLNNYKFIKNIMENKEYIKLDKFNREYKDMQMTIKFKEYTMIFKLSDKIYKIEFNEMQGITKEPFEVIKKTKIIEIWEEI